MKKMRKPLEKEKNENERDLETKEVHRKCWNVHTLYIILNTYVCVTAVVQSDSKYYKFCLIYRGFLHLLCCM